MAYARRKSPTRRAGARRAAPRRSTRRAAPRTSRAGGVLRIVVENAGGGVTAPRHLGPGGGVQPVASAVARDRAKF